MAELEGEIVSFRCPPHLLEAMDAMLSEVMSGGLRYRTRSRVIRVALAAFTKPFGRKEKPGTAGPRKRVARKKAV